MSSTNTQITCPNCNAGIAMCITGISYHAYDTHAYISPTSPRYFYNDSPNGSPYPKSPPHSWLGDRRNDELKEKHNEIYCVCSNDSHDIDRSYAHPCLVCGTNICAHTKCRHSHEKNDCDYTGARRSVRFNHVGGGPRTKTQSVCDYRNYSRYY